MPPPRVVSFRIIVISYSTMGFKNTLDALDKERKPPRIIISSLVIISYSTMGFKNTLDALDKERKPPRGKDPEHPMRRHLCVRARVCMYV